MGGYIRKRKEDKYEKLHDTLAFLSSKVVMTGIVIGVVLGVVGITITATQRQSQTNSNASGCNPAKEFCIIKPADGQTQVPVAITFSWSPYTATSDQKSYTLVIHNELTNKYLQFTIDAHKTSFTLPPGTLTPETKYSWFLFATRTSGQTQEAGNTGVNPGLNFFTTQ